MCQSKGGTVLVGDKSGTLQGIFTTGDLKRGLSIDSEILSKDVAEVMVKKPTTVNVDEMAVVIIDILRKKNINAIPVVDGKNSIRGVIDIQDLPKFKVL